MEENRVLVKTPPIKNLDTTSYITFTVFLFTPLPLSLVRRPYWQGAICRVRASYPS